MLSLIMLIIAIQLTCKEEFKKKIVLLINGSKLCPKSEEIPFYFWDLQDNFFLKKKKKEKKIDKTRVW